MSSKGNPHMVRDALIGTAFIVVLFWAYLRASARRPEHDGRLMLGVVGAVLLAVVLYFTLTPPL